jgi:hypothetical protein
MSCFVSRRSRSRVKRVVAVSPTPHDGSHPSASRVPICIRRALLRFGLAVGLIGLAAFLVTGGLSAVVMASYASWGPSTNPRGARAILIGVWGGLSFGPMLAVRFWYLSTPLVLLTAYAWLALRRLKRERTSRGADKPHCATDAV